MAIDTNPNFIFTHHWDSVNDNHNEVSDNFFDFNVVDLQTIVKNKSNEKI